VECNRKWEAAAAIAAVLVNGLNDNFILNALKNETQIK
jgi:hypothetical protein